MSSLTPSHLEISHSHTNLFLPICCFEVGYGSPGKGKYAELSSWVPDLSGERG
jgi:hypothetical protein